MMKKSFKINHIELKSIHSWLRYENKYLPDLYNY